MCVYKNTHRYLYTYNNLFNYYICCFLKILQEDLITIVTETEEAMDDELGDVAAADDDSTNNAALQKACFTNETLANSDTVEVTIEDDNKEKESETPNIPKEIENQFRAVIERIRHEKFGIGLELNEEGQLLTKVCMCFMY